MPGTTLVHLVRHGEVHNPEGILYGRLPGYHLSDLGRQMAEAVVPFFAGRDLALVVCVGSAHRALAFDVCREVVEEIKRELPVWKKQHQADGAHVWSGLTC